MLQVEQNYRSGRLRVADVPAPMVPRAGLLVETRVSLISAGTERQLMELARASLAGKAMARPDLVRQVLRGARRDGLRATAQKVAAKLDKPIPLGYSLAGRVLEAGPEAGGFAVGDRVACAGAGMANHAEVNAVPRNLCVRIPDAVSDEQASFVTLGAIAMQGVRQAAPSLGERVVVIGLGLIGLLSVQLLKANGCRVLGVDPDAGRAALARDLGADIAVTDGLEAAAEQFTDGVGADAVIVAASSKSSALINQAGEISRMKGRVVVVGLVGMALDRDVFYRRELDLKLSMSYGPGRHDPEYELAGRDYPLPYVRWTEARNMESFLHLVAEGRVTPERLISHRFAISDAGDAYDLMARGEAHLAMLLTCPGLGDAPPRREILRKAGTGREKALRIGFVGLGNYAGSVLLPALRAAGDVTLTRVATATGLSACNAGDRHGFAHIGTDPETVLGADDTDIVMIATRHDSHADLAVRALDAGKHVFVEKPLALNLDDLDRVIAAEAAAPGLLLVGYNRRFAPMIRRAKSVLDEVPGPKMMLYRVNAGQIPADSWIGREEVGGRILGEVCHFVDTLTCLAGSLPIEAHAIGLRGQADAVSVQLRFADGSVGTILYSPLGDAALGKEYLEVFAAGTVVQIDDFTRLTITSGGRTDRRMAAQDKGQRPMLRAFLDAVRGGGPAPVAMTDLIAVSEAVLAILASLRSGGPVAFGGGA